MIVRVSTSAKLPNLRECLRQMGMYENPWLTVACCVPAGSMRLQSNTAMLYVCVVIMIIPSRISMCSRIQMLIRAAAANSKWVNVKSIAIERGLVVSWTAVIQCIDIISCSFIYCAYDDGDPGDLVWTLNMATSKRRCIFEDREVNMTNSRSLLWKLYL